MPEQRSRQMRNLTSVILMLGQCAQWVYLQLGTHFGNIPYVTNPWCSSSDLKETAVIFQ